MSAARPARILVADDHPLYRRGLAALLNAQDGWEVVAEEADGVGAVTAARTTSPDVVVIDLNMPGLDGIEATRRIVAHSPQVGVLVLTMYDDDGSVFAAMRAGARGYIPKDADSEELLRAIRAAAVGEAIFGASIARRMMTFFAAGARGPADPFPELTEREREILELIAAGRSNGDIAQRLGITGKTVRNHVANVFNKLQVADRSQAIVRAREAGLGTDTTPR